MCTAQNLPQKPESLVIHFFLSPEGNFTHISAGFHALGYDPDEVIGRHFSEFIHPDDVAQVSRKGLQEAYAKQQLPDSAHRRVMDERRCSNRLTTALPVRLRVRIDGAATYVQVLISAAGVYHKRDDQRIFEGTCGTIHLPRKALKIGDFYSATPDPIHLNLAPTLLHAGGLIIAANPKAWELFQVNSEEDIVGRNIHEFLPEYIELADQETATRGTFVAHMLVNSSGQRIEVHATEIVTRRMGYEVRKLVLFPVTEQNRPTYIPSRLLQHLSSLNQAINHHAIVAITDRAGRIVYVNDKFCQISGYSRHELIGQNHRILKSGYHPKSFYTEMWQTITSGEIWNGVVCNRSKTGDLYWVRTTITPILDDNHRPVQFVSIRTDITEQKNTETRLRDAMEKLDRANLAKTVFLGNMSHEIRNPINGIMGLCSLAMEKANDEETQKYLRLIRATSQSVLELLNNLLEQSRIDEGRFQKTEQEFFLREEIDTLLQSFAVLAEQKKNHFVAEISSNLPNVFVGDILCIRQILTNLLSNAIKFTSNGEIHIAVTGEPDKTDEKLCHITICVSDNGIGIPPEKLSNLFERFNEASLNTTASYGGSGLGMSLVQQFAKLLGGSITVHSPAPRYNCGTEFCVTLPLKQSKAKVPPRTETQTKKLAELRLHQSPKKVLVVDDDAINRFYLKKLIENLGHEIHTVENGHAALEVLRRETFDVIVMDIRMPGLDGLETTRILREEISSEIPVIGISANTSDEDIAGCLEAGMNQFIGKPFSPLQIAEALNQYRSLSSERKT